MKMKLMGQPLSFIIPSISLSSTEGLPSARYELRVGFPVALLHICGCASISVKATNVRGCRSGDKNWEARTVLIINRNPPLTIRLHLPCSYQLKHPSIPSLKSHFNFILTSCREFHSLSLLDRFIPGITLV